MTIGTLFRYSVGSRRAILEIASCPSALWLGVLLVLSAGLAREYDGADLLHEPWHLLIPLAASLVTSFGLFCIVFAAARNRGIRDGSFGNLYRSFLSLFWMTAPLAWLYAIPVERFLSPGDAVVANLWLLALVSLWRVALITRVITVLFGATGIAVFWLVMLFADTLALTILRLTPLPVFNFMGGIRHSPSDQAIQDVAFMVGFWGALTWPVWLIGSCVIVLSKRPGWRLASAGAPESAISRPLKALALVAVVGWVFVLPRTQPEQQLKRQVEFDLRSGDVDRALRTMSTAGRDAFPPHWDPPPRMGYGEREPSFLSIAQAIARTTPDSWVRRLFASKVMHHFSLVPEGDKYAWWGISDKQLDERIALLETFSEGREVIAGQWPSLKERVDRENADPDLRRRVLALESIEERDENQR